MAEEKRDVLFRVSVDFGILILSHRLVAAGFSKLFVKRINLPLCWVALPSFILEVVGVPFHRGFFCDDETISLPTKPDTVPIWAVAVAGIGLNFVVMILVELFIHIKLKRGLSLKDPKQVKQYQICKRDVHPYFVALYKSLGYFLLGCAISQGSTDISKYNIGRLRPFFLDACQPDYSKFNCTDSRGVMQYITADVCTGDEHLIKEARLSHPSGHSSFSVFSMVYLSLYLQSKLTWTGSKLYKYMLEAAALYLALYVCLSRISDHRHHWSDVFGGGVLGAIVALIVGVLISDLYTRPNFRALSSKLQELRNVTERPPEGYGSTNETANSVALAHRD